MAKRWRCANDRIEGDGMGWLSDCFASSQFNLDKRPDFNYVASYFHFSPTQKQTSLSFEMFSVLSNTNWKFQFAVSIKFRVFIGISPCIHSICKAFNHMSLDWMLVKLFDFDAKLNFVEIRVSSFGAFNDCPIVKLGVCKPSVLVVGVKARIAWYKFKQAIAIKTRLIF